MNKLRKIKNDNGLTLIELLISIALLGVTLAIATTIIIQAYNIVPSGSRRMSAKQMAEMHVTEIARHIRNNEELEVNGNTVDISSSDEITIEENGVFALEIEVNDETNIYHDIVYFELNNANDSYLIILEKEYDGDEGRVRTEVSPRD